MRNQKTTSGVDGSGTDAPRVSRARSVRSARPFRMAVFYWSLAWLGMGLSLTVLAVAIATPDPLMPQLLIGALAFGGLMWLIAFFKRRAACCPLCKGTPLLNSGAMPHQRARRLPPFNHGVSAMLSIMVRQRFHCMYCASEYDLLKPRMRHSYPEPPPVPGDGRGF
jgi:hypothetical protein